MSTMKRQILSQENLLKKLIFKINFLILFFILLNSNVIAKEKWIIDKNISKITFEVPVLFASNVVGEFKKFDGYVEIDLKNKKDNKAILSVNIDSMTINYEKYRDLILGPVFFDISNYPLGVLDTKKFSYSDENELTLDVELTIKGKSKIINTELKVERLTTDIVQILGRLEFNRNDYSIGTGNWSNTSILKNKITIETNIFLMRE